MRVVKCGVVVYGGSLIDKILSAESSSSPVTQLKNIWIRDSLTRFIKPIVCFALIRNADMASHLCHVSRQAES